MIDRNEVKLEVAKNIMFYRKQRKITQKQLADMLHTKHNTLSNWETGRSSIDMDTLIQICDILSISFDDVFGKYARTANKFSSDELHLIQYFRQLNNDGQEKLIDYADDLTSSGKYSNNGVSPDVKSVG